MSKRTISWIGFLGAAEECYNTPRHSQHRPEAAAGTPSRSLQTSIASCSGSWRTLASARSTILPSTCCATLPRTRRASGTRAGAEAGAGHRDEEEPLTSEEIEIIQERLQNLGYL
jgi:hypothetical protein